MTYIIVGLIVAIAISTVILYHWSDSYRDPKPSYPSIQDIAFAASIGFLAGLIWPFAIIAGLVAIISFVIVRFAKKQNATTTDTQN